MGIELGTAAIIGGIVSGGAQLYGAKRAGDIAAGSQAKQDEVADFQLEVSRQAYDDYRRYIRDCEIAHIEDICSRERCEVDEENVRNNNLVQVERAFGVAREKMYRCSEILCVGATKAQETALNIAEANAAIDASERAVRRERDRCDLLNARQDELLTNLMNYGRGAITASNQAGSIAAKLYGEQASGAGALAAYSLDQAFRSFGRAGRALGQQGANVTVNTQQGGTGRIEFDPARRVIPGDPSFAGGDVGEIYPSPTSFNPGGGEL